MTSLNSACPWPLAELQSLAEPQIKDTAECREGDRFVLVSELYFPAAPYRGQPTRAFGYFARPKAPAEDRLPAMLLIHGGGGAANPWWTRSWARRGYAALAVDLAGQGPDGKPLPGGGPAFSPSSFLLSHGIENTWMYHAVATCLAGVSALASLPEVDPERIGVTGVSWGGYFCCIVMSIDERVALGIPMYGCGFNPRVANGNDPAFQDGRLQREAFDPSNFLPWCRKPVLWVTTTNDANAPLDELQLSLRATPGPSTLCLTANPGHLDPRSIGLGQRPEIEYFADSVFRGGEPLVSLDEPTLSGQTLTVPSGAGATWAVVHFTTDLEKPWPERQWHSARAERSENMIHAQLPLGRRLVAFINVCDARDAVVACDWREVEA